MVARQRKCRERSCPARWKTVEMAHLVVCVVMRNGGRKEERKEGRRRRRKLHDQSCQIIAHLCAFDSAQFSCSVEYNSATPGLPDCRTPGLPVHYQLPDLAHTHIHRVGDAIQPSHPLSSPSPPAPNPSQPSESFPMSQVLASGSQSIGVLASA